MTDYSKMTQNDFNERLAMILSDIKASNLLDIPGIYEILSEEFHNEVLDHWKSEQENND